MTDRDHEHLVPTLFQSNRGSVLMAHMTRRRDPNPRRAERPATAAERDLAEREERLMQREQFIAQQLSRLDRLEQLLQPATAPAATTTTTTSSKERS